MLRLKLISEVAEPVGLCGLPRGARSSLTGGAGEGRWSKAKLH